MVDERSATFPICIRKPARLKPHPNHMARMIVILHLRLRQRGLLHRRPHHGLAPLIQAAIHHEFHELIRNHRLGVVIHGQIRVSPVAGHPKPLEFLALHINPAFGKSAAFLTEIDDINIVLVQALGAVLLFDLPFDRQTVTIPARHITGVFAHHLLAAHHHILEDLVQRMADVQMPVRIGRPVMQRKGRAAGLGAQGVINADPLPPRQPIGLALRQSGAHREFGLRQKHGVTVVGVAGVGRGCIGAHQMRSLLINRRVGAYHSKG